MSLKFSFIGDKTKAQGEKGACWGSCTLLRLVLIEVLSSYTAQSEWWNFVLFIFYSPQLFISWTLWIFVEIRILPLHTFWPIQGQKWASLQTFCKYVPFFKIKCIYTNDDVGDREWRKIWRILFYSLFPLCLSTTKFIIMLPNSSYWSFRCQWANNILHATREFWKLISCS